MSLGGQSTKMNPGILMGLSYLSGIDTADFDEVNSNFQDLAKQMSESGNLGDWNWSVDGSDEARQRAEAAAFQSYLDKTTPIYEQQTDDLHTRLINQGLTPGSEAYQRAMTDLQNNQNDATNLAAYNATLAGQNAFSQSLNDQINAGNFGNNAQTGYVNQIWNLLSNSMSDYDKNMAMANLLTSGYNQQQAAKRANAQGINSFISNGLMAAAKAAGGMGGGMSAGGTGAGAGAAGV